MLAIATGWLAVGVLSQLAGTALPASQDFLTERSTAADGSRHAAVDGRWVLYSTTDAEQTRRARGLLQEFHFRIEELLGPTPNPIGQPARLVLLRDAQDQEDFCLALGQAFPALRHWAERHRFEPARLLIWDPAISMLRWEKSYGESLPPELELAHYAVHLELTRRFGSFPHWFGEGLSYALQQERLGAVSMASNRQSMKLETGYTHGWLEDARRHWTQQNERGVAWLGRRDTPFDEAAARLQFGFGHWLLQQEPARVRSLAQELASACSEDWRIDVDYPLDAGEQRALLETFLGHSLEDELASYWEAWSPTAEADTAFGRARCFVAQLADERGLERYETRKSRVTLFSDADEAKVKRALKDVEKVLRRIERAFPFTADATATPPALFLLEDQRIYRDLCHGLSRTDLMHFGYLEDSLMRSGFLLPGFGLAACCDNPKAAAGSRPGHSLSHLLTHLELRRRLGELPAWLMEGLACALEDQALGEVQAACASAPSLKGSSNDWREDTHNWIRNQVVKKRQPSFEALYGATPASASEERSPLLAYGFALYGLEKEPKAFAKLLDGIRAEFRARGCCTIPSERMQALVASSYGEDFCEGFARWWKRKPVRKR